MANARARQLRLNQTDAERRLWAALRDRRLVGYKFRRQRPIGPFIVDFVCIEHKLVIEADGGQHADNEADESRTAWLQGRGWRVLRFWNNEILANTRGVIETIVAALRKSRQPSPSQSFGSGPSLSHFVGEGLRLSRLRERVASVMRCMQSMTRDG